MFAQVQMQARLNSHHRFRAFITAGMEMGFQSISMKKVSRLKATLTDCIGQEGGVCSKERRTVARGC
jgi:hypothetical protein